ncbi:MAG TPA: hypothetical protein VG873_00565, partial [Burkholderiales bacterium]|nr:hypothetical protein [Burkholderiales bacterium]
GAYGLVVKGGTVDSQNAHGPGGAVAGATVTAGRTRTSTALGAIQAQSLDLEVNGSILLQGGASNVRSGATIADTSAAFLVTGQKNIRTTNSNGVADPSFGSLLVKGGRAYNNSGNASVAPNIRSRGQVDPSDLNITLDGIAVLHGGEGGAGTLVSSQLVAGDSITIATGGPASYTYTSSAGAVRTVTGEILLIGGTGSGTFGQGNVRLTMPNYLIQTSAPLTYSLDAGLGDAVIQVGRSLFDNSLLGYVIFAANEETRAGRIRKGLGEGDDLGAPACK